jgi:O-antigen ligase
MNGVNEVEAVNSYEKTKGRTKLLTVGAFAAIALVSFVFFSQIDQASLIPKFIVGLGGSAVLVLCPEVTLGLYPLVGNVKTDERLSFLGSADLTIVLVAFVWVGIIVKYFRKGVKVHFPAAYGLFVPFVLMMVVSLTYTPDLDAGLDKVARFLTLTSTAIVGPFLVLQSSREFKRFLYTYGAGAFLISLNSLTMLGGKERLTTPSSTTIDLGLVGVTGVLVIWFLILPGLSFRWRLVFYPLLAVCAFAVLGSGSRGPFIVLCCCMALSLFLYRNLIKDAGLMVLGLLLALPFVHIPEASFDYLRLLLGGDPEMGRLGFRSVLMNLGWQMIKEHPLVGVGIQGFRYHTSNVTVYNWPHNIFLEIGSELGIPSALAVLGILAAAVWQAVKLFREATPRHRTLAATVAAFLVMGLLDFMNTGDINSGRVSWMCVSLVFALQGVVLNEEAGARVKSVGQDESP